MNGRQSKAVKAAATNRAVAKAKTLATKANASAVNLSSPVTKIGASFDQGVTGAGSQRFSFAQMNQAPFTGGYGLGIYGGMHFPGSRVSSEGVRDRYLVVDQILSNPTLHAVFQQNAVSVVGDGIRTTYSPDWESIGLDPDTEDCRRFERQVQAYIDNWATNPIHCSHEGTMDFVAMQREFVNKLAVSGEYACQLLFRSRFGGPYLKVLPITPWLVDTLWTRTLDNGNVVNSGLEYDNGVLVAIWFRNIPVGSIYFNGAQPIRLPLWALDRPNAIFYRDTPFYGMIRGNPLPFAAAAQPARDRETLGQLFVGKMSQTASLSFAITSDLPTNEAMSIVMPAAGSGTPFGSLQGYVSAKLSWYGTQGDVSPTTPSGALNPEARLGRTTLPGNVLHLLPGEKAEALATPADHNSLESVSSFMLRDAAMHAGVSYVGLSDDMRQVSFSAAKLSMQLERRHTMAKRRTLIERFVKPVIQTLIEEAVLTGRVRLPFDCPPFWFSDVKQALSQCEYIGPPAPSASPLEDSQNDLLEVQSGFSSYEQVLNRRGQSLDAVLRQRAREKRKFERAGLPLPMGAEDWTRPNSNISQQFREQIDENVEPKGASNAK